MRLAWAVAAAGVGLGAASCGGSPNSRAFAAAEAAVRAQQHASAGGSFQDLSLRSLTGLKGSKAQVVCGTVSTPAAGDTPFVYVWTLAAAVPDPGRRAGELLLLTRIDRRAANELNHFCSDAPAGSAANAYDYFN